MIIPYNLLFLIFLAVKHDCVFGDDFDLAEISLVSDVCSLSLSLQGTLHVHTHLLIRRVYAQVIKQLDRPIVYSLSPGTSVTPAMAKSVSGLANMYRITGDDWDTWNDIVSHFDITR